MTKTIIMRSVRLRFLSCGLAIFSFLADGCGRQPFPGPTPQPVQGKVTYRGRPAGGFRVTFHPLDDLGRVKFAPASVTDADGAFRLRSYDPDDGAPAGKYAVTFSWPRHVNALDEPDPAPEVDQLQGKYDDPENSPFIVTVQQGENILPAFDLK
jgi:hypothetical protein